MKAGLDAMKQVAMETPPEESGKAGSGDGSHMSEATTPTDAGSYSEEESFLEALGVDFRTLAVSIRQTAGGVVNFVHRSAMTVAAEIARLEENDHHDDVPGTDSWDDTPIPLPWEIWTSDLGTYEEDTELKERIMAVSEYDQNFLQPASQHSTDFVLDDARIHLIRRLLDIDSNLARAHARLSGRSHVHEAAFWKNYFDRCEEQRQHHFARYERLDELNDRASIQSQDSLVGADSDDEEDEDVLSSFVLPSPPTSTNSADIRSVDSIVFVDKHK